MDVLHPYDLINSRNPKKVLLISLFLFLKKSQRKQRIENPLMYLDVPTLGKKCSKSI